MRRRRTTARFPRVVRQNHPRLSPVGVPGCICSWVLDISLIVSLIKCFGWNHYNMSFIDTFPHVLAASSIHLCYGACFIFAVVGNILEMFFLYEPSLIYVHFLNVGCSSLISPIVGAHNFQVPPTRLINWLYILNYNNDIQYEIRIVFQEYITCNEMVSGSKWDGCDNQQFICTRRLNIHL